MLKRTGEICSEGDGGIYSMIKKFIAVLLLTLFLWSLYGCKEDVIYTENIAHYEEYGVNEWDIFPNKIPTNATVIKFSYYTYFSEACDVYLELKFETLSEMEFYLSEFKSTVLENYPSKEPLYNDDCWFVIDCPYNKNYEESICFSSAAYRPSDNSYTVGYSVENSIAEFHWSVLSYSKEDLCVIHSYIRGRYHKANDHTPMYLQRFGVTLDKDINQMYVFYDKDSKLFLSDEN